MELAKDLSMLLTMALGCLVLIWAIAYLLIQVYDLVLTLFKINKTIVDWFVYKGRCRECRKKVYKPKSQSDKTANCVK